MALYIISEDLKCFWGDPYFSEVDVRKDKQEQKPYSLVNTKHLTV